MNIGLTRHILSEMHLVSNNSAIYIIYAFLFENFGGICYTIFKNKYHIFNINIIYII